MQLNKKTPSEGLKILENFYEKLPKNQLIKGSLIHGYIKLGIHDAAINMIKNSPIKNLYHKAWLAHKNNDINQEREIWREILSKQYFATVDSDFKLIQYSEKEIQIQSNDIPLLCMIHNEMLRLPFFLEYYRNLGVTQFIFIDNNSNDGCLEFLLQQPDCHVFWTNDSHHQTGSGMAWIHHVIKVYIPKNQWCIHPDADEFLVYPNCETIKLPKLIEYLNSKNFAYLSSFMLDMFPKDIRTQIDIKSGDNLLQKSPYFYNNYKFYHQIQPPYICPKGGIFQLFNINFWWTKTALFKATDNFRFLSSTHATTPVNIANISSAYLHFKMIGDFEKKAINEQKRKQHWAGGIHYKGYAKMYQGFENKNFDFTKLNKTTKYQNSQQLVELGLIKTSEEWEKFCATQ